MIVAIGCIFVALILVIQASRREIGYGIFSPPFWFATTFIAYDSLQAIVLFLYDGKIYMETKLASDYEWELMLGFIVIAVAAVSWLIGYQTAPKVYLNTSSRDKSSTLFDIKTTSFVCSVVGVISFAFTLYYASLVGVDFGDYSTLFAKRVVLSDSGEFLAYGYLRMAAGAAQYSLPVVVACALVSVRTLRHLPSYMWVAMAVNILSAMIFPLVTSSRGMIISAAISVLICVHLLLRKIRARTVLYGAFCAVVLLSFLSALRLEAAEVVSANSVPAYFQPFTYGGGQSIFNTGVVAGYAEEHGYKFGETYAGLIFAPVPRSIWLEKPQVVPDQYIAEHVYGYVGSGWYLVPPGYFGELYLNFGIVGVVLGGFVLARIVRLIGIKLWWLATQADVKAAIYYVLLVKFFNKLLGSSFGAALIEGAISFVVVWLIFAASAALRGKRLGPLRIG